MVVSPLFGGFTAFDLMVYLYLLVASQAWGYTTIRMALPGIRAWGKEEKIGAAFVVGISLVVSAVLATAFLGAFLENTRNYFYLAFLSGAAFTVLLLKLATSAFAPAFIEVVVPKLYLATRAAISNGKPELIPREVMYSQVYAPPTTFPSTQQGRKASLLSGLFKHFNPEKAHAEKMLMENPFIAGDLGNRSLGVSKEVLEELPASSKQIPLAPPPPPPGSVEKDSGKHRREQREKAAKEREKGAKATEAPAKPTGLKVSVPELIAKSEINESEKRKALKKVDSLLSGLKQEASSELPSGHRRKYLEAQARKQLPAPPSPTEAPQAGGRVRGERRKRRGERGEPVQAQPVPVQEQLPALELGELPSLEEVGGEKAPESELFSLQDLDSGIKDSELPSLEDLEKTNATAHSKQVKNTGKKCESCGSANTTLVVCHSCGKTFCAHCALKVEQKPDGAIEYACPECAAVTVSHS
ncbi:MAG TPA: hypothetical protein VJA40_00755 [archaeon]|nr:hypothetical protein [archaeon]